MRRGAQGRAVLGLVLLVAACTGRTGDSTGSSSSSGGTASSQQGSTSGGSSRASGGSSQGSSASSAMAGGISSTSGGSGGSGSGTASSVAGSGGASSVGGSSAQASSGMDSSGGGASSVGMGSSSSAPFGSSSGDVQLRPGPCARITQTATGMTISTSLLSYDGAGRLASETVDRDGDRQPDTVLITQRDAMGRVTLVTVDENVDGLPDVLEEYGYDGAGPLKNITRTRLSTGRAEQVTLLEVDGMGRLTRRSVDDFGDGIMDVVTTYVYGADDKVLEEFIQSQGRTTRCVLSYSGTGAEQLRVCSDVDTQQLRYTWERVFDAAGNLLGELRDENADGAADTIIRTDYACWANAGSSSSSGGAVSSSAGASSQGTASSTAGGSSSSGGATPPCQDSERGPTSPASPQAIPVTCPHFTLTQASLDAGDEDVFVVRLAAGQELIAETYGAQPGSCAGVDTVVDVRPWPLGGATRTPYCSGTPSQLACDDDGGVDACSRVRFVAPSAADYALRVVALGGMTVVGQYGMVVDVRQPGCGDGVKDAAEACDDGNTASGDGCSAACALEGDSCAAPVVLAPVLGGAPLVVSGLTTVGQTNAYSAACATTGATPDTVFQVTPTANGTLRVTLQGLDGFDGVLALSRLACSPGTQVGCQNATGPGDTESLVAAVLANTPYWLHVDGQNGSTGRYLLSVAMEPAACGNGVVEAGEECDDHNSVNNDGCSAACVDECRAQTEVGATTFDTPMVIPSFCRSWQLVAGAINPTGDQDYFRVTVLAGEQLRVDTYGTSPTTCSFDTVVEVRASPLTGDPTGTASSCNSPYLSCDDDSGPSNCSSLRWTATATGDYVVRVKEYGSNATIPAYTLVIARQ